MGSNKRSDRHSPISPAATSSTSFYKIILPSAMQYHRLRIPEDFSKKYGNELSTSVRFTVRSGQVCRVGVEEADKMLWFTNGWKEFCETHSIGCGFFLVFNYVGDSKFNVLIFDLTATEIYNPRKTLGIHKEPNRGKQCPVFHKGERESNDTLENLSCHPSTPANVSSENGILDGYWGQRTDKRCCHSLIQNMYEFAPEFAVRINKRGRCISSLESLRCNFHYFTRNKRRKMEDGKIKAAVLSKGIIIASEMPNSQRSAAHKIEKEKWNVMKNVDNLPEAVPFARHCCLSDGGREDKEGLHNQLDLVFVQEATRKSKGIGYQLNETIQTRSAEVLNPSNAGNHRGNDSNGQQLKVKLEEEEELLGVSDFRNDSMMRAVTSQDREKAFDAIMKFKLNNPCFTKIIQPYNVLRSFILNVPARFAKEYLHGGSNDIQLEVSGGKQWTVHCIRVKGTVQCLSKGWHQFSKDNTLGIGDVCVFEVIQVEDVVLKVSIFRTSENTKQNILQIRKVVDRHSP